MRAVCCYFRRVLAGPSDVAKRLGVSRVAVYKAIRAGRFAAVQVFCVSGPLRVFIPDGKPLRAAPETAGKCEFVTATFLARRLRVSPTLVRSACAAGLIGVWCRRLRSSSLRGADPRERGGAYRCLS